MAAHPTQTTSPFCSRFAWSDDRLAPGANWHVFNQYGCSDGYLQFGNDVRVDQPPTINATNPAITNQQQNSNQPLDYAIAWQADRSGTTLHDIYVRFFTFIGTPKGNQVPVSTPLLGVDARAPAVASDPSLNVFVAWEEFNTSTLDGSIWISKYNPDGTTRLAGPVRVNTKCLSGTGCVTPATERHEPALAVDSAGNVVVAWWDRRSDLTQPETIVRRRLTGGLGAIDTSEQQVNQPPAAPAGVKRVFWADVATDSSNRFAVTWWANVNNQFVTSANIFARGFDAAGANLKNDFRVDLAPRTAFPLGPRVARSSQAKKFVYAWQDNRSGHLDAYSRVVKSVP